MPTYHVLLQLRWRSQLSNNGGRFGLLVSFVEGGFGPTLILDTRE